MVPNRLWWGWLAAGCGGGPTAGPDAEEVAEADVRTSWFGTEDGPVELTYEMVDGEAIFEGDIVLPDPGARSATASAFGTRWPYGIVRVENTGLYNDPRVVSAIRKWETQTSLRFVFGATTGDRVRFLAHASLCSSSIGRVGGLQTINLAPGCYHSEVVHEIGHAVGLYHEQSRPDRDQHVTVNWDCIQTGKSHNFNLASTSMGVGEYDLDSMMHYGSSAFLDWNKTENGLPCEATLTTTDGGYIFAGRGDLSPTDIAGVESMYAIYGPRPPLDYTPNGGDGYTDFTVYRPTYGQWWIGDSAAGYTAPWPHHWGVLGDVPVPGDYDGDGIVDLAVYRPTAGEWWLLRSGGDTTTLPTFGGPDFVPIPGDYDGDGTTDPALYRHSDATWHVLPSSGDPGWFEEWMMNHEGQQPVPGDYDGDGRDDFAVWDPQDGTWWVHPASGPDQGLMFGSWSDIPVPADYDGDGAVDYALYRPATGYWDIRRFDGSVVAQVYWGLPADVPVPGNYSGDGALELGVYDTRTSVWWIADLSGWFLWTHGWGAVGDVPVQ